MTNTHSEDNLQFESSVTTKFNVIEIEESKKKQKENLDKITSETRAQLTKLVDIAFNRQDQLIFQEYMGKERKLPKEVFYQCKGFFIPDFEYNDSIFFEDLRNKHMGLMSENGYPRFVGRFIYPIMDFNGQVIGLIGYDKHSDVKYLLSTTINFGKSNSFYGMWMMRWIYKMGYIIVVEGIVDCLWLWMHGYPAIALNGNTLNGFVVRILKRFGYSVLFIPDNDETGHVSIRYWKKDVPKASVLHLTEGNDIDKWRKITNERGEKKPDEIFEEVVKKFKLNIESNRRVELRITNDYDIEYV